MVESLNEKSSLSLIVKKKPNPIFVVDPDPQFLESIWSNPNADLVAPVVAQLGREAQGILSQYTNKFSGIFVNPELEDMPGLSVVRAAHYYHPAIPIFLICNDRNPLNPRVNFTEQDLKNLGIQDVIYKPVSYGDLIKRVTVSMGVFDPRDAFDLADKMNAAEGTTTSISDNAFFPILAQDFLSGTKSFFDVYIRLGQGRYLKLLRAGDSFTVDRVMAYIQKGVTHFYLRKEAQELYINFCDKLVAAIIRSPNTPMEVKVRQTYHHGNETLTYLRSKGVDESTLEHATGFVENLDALVKQLELEKVDVLKTLLADATMYDHGIGTAMISAVLARAINIAYNKSVHILGLGSLLHDVGLFEQPAAIQQEDESLMSPKQLEIYHSHPSVGASILSEVPKLDPMICQIVEQHHERKNKTGFPRQLGGGAILQFAEIIGISDEFVRLIHKQKRDPTIEPLFLTVNMLDNFSPAISDAFYRVFLRNNQDMVR